jgi:putative ABC transport system permease protein
VVKKGYGAPLLRRKLIRDIRDHWKSFAAVFIICMLSTMLYSGLDAAWRGMEKNLSVQFRQCGLADIWIAGPLSDRKARDITKIQGVIDAQRRVHLRASADLKGDPTVELYMSDGAPRVNSPMVFKGQSLPSGRKNVCVLDSRFAKAQGLSAGDHLTVDAAGTSLELTVGGIGYSPEYVVYSDGFAFSANPSTFGYAYLSPGTLSFLPYQETVVRLNPNADVSQVKQEIQTLLDNPGMLVLTRDDKAGIKMAIEEVGQIRALGQVFPAVFFLVAALITFSTMRRMVESQRLQIGTLCSLGYDRAQLIRHYTGYGLLVSALGALFGLVGACFFLGRIVMWVLMSIYNMPDAAVYMHPGIMAGTFLLTVLIAMGASFLSCSRALKEVPAGLLRPKPPSHGKRVLLERIPFLWRRLSFSSKLIIRNMFRNTSRLLIGIVGVVGCSALLLTGFGMRDSVLFVLENHYTHTMRYDVRVDLNAAATENYPEAVRLRAGAQRMETVMERSCELQIDGRWQTKSLHVLEDRHEMVYLERDGERIWLPKEGITLSERATEETGLKIGDSVKIRAPNGHETTASVQDIISIQLGQGVYVSKSAWRKLDLMPYTPTAVFLSGGNIDPAAVENMDGVAKVRTIDVERTGSEAVVKVLDVVVLVMVLFSGALLLVVLFTLGQLNFFERMRELATLMVLGFYPRETKHLILRENIIIAILGLPLGLYLGPFLHRWVLTYGFPNMLEFIPYIASVSWIYTPLLTLLFAQIVNILIGVKFKSVDMVEALKSVE